MRNTAATVIILVTALTALPAKAETYRLIHAVGNAENEAARGLSKAECESRKIELKAVAEGLGTYSEALGNGSITCLPESLFAD